MTDVTDAPPGTPGWAERPRWVDPSTRVNRAYAKMAQLLDELGPSPFDAA